MKQENKVKAKSSNQHRGQTGTGQYLKIFGWSLGTVLVISGMFQENSPFAPWNIPIMIIATTFAVPMLLMSCIHAVLDEREAAQDGTES